MREALLTAEGLSVQYRSRSKPAFRDLEFTLGEGEVCALTGDSGSGKTTLARALGNLLSPDRAQVHGVVRIRARSVLGKAGAIAVVSQDPEQALNPVLRVGTQIEETVRLRRPGWRRRQERQRRVMELLASVALAEAGISRAYPGDLSGGQRQRVAIAQALGVEPEVLIADEPTSALDDENEMQVMTCLRTWAKTTGGSLLLITHDLVLAREADRVLAMGDGPLRDFVYAGDAR